MLDRRGLRVDSRRLPNTIRRAMPHEPMRKFRPFEFLQCGSAAPQPCDSESRVVHSNEPGCNRADGLLLAAWYSPGDEDSGDYERAQRIFGVDSGGRRGVGGGGGRKLVHISAE